jgi:hypothetical protein
MKSFQYQILRFLPDRVSEEFLNLGVVVYDKQTKQLAVEIIEKTGRLSQVFPESNTRYILKTIKHIDTRLKIIADQLSKEFEFEKNNEISLITKRALPKDDSALFFTESQNILDIDINSVSTYLFDRLIGVNQSDSEKEFRNDKEVWSKVYKQYFDDLNISKHLTPAKINTKFNPVEFEHTWRNGHLNFFEPVNFDLEKLESIRNKVFRWSGQIDELKTANEHSHLYLLSILPKNDLKVRSFINDFLSSKSSEEVKVEIVTPENVEDITKGLKVEFESHSK